MNKRPCKKARLCSTSSEEEADLPPGGSLWDLLSSLPDLVLAHLLSIFLPPSHGCTHLPPPQTIRTINAIYLISFLFLYFYLI
jgi:hypothetical protein